MARNDLIRIAYLSLKLKVPIDDVFVTSIGYAKINHIHPPSNTGFQPETHRKAVLLAFNFFGLSKFTWTR